MQKLAIPAWQVHSNFSNSRNFWRYFDIMASCHLTWTISTVLVLRNAIPLQKWPWTSHHKGHGRRFRRRLVYKRLHTVRTVPLHRSHHSTIAAGSWSPWSPDHGRSWNKFQPFDPVITCENRLSGTAIAQHNVVFFTRKTPTTFYARNLWQQKVSIPRSLLHQEAWNLHVCIKKNVRHKSDYHLFLICWTVGHAPKYAK